MLTRLCDLLEAGLMKIAAVLCLVLLACMFMEVLNRYVFAVSWPWLQFIIPFCFLWMCMLGSAIAVRRQQHFVVDILAKVLRGGGREAHRLFVTASVCAGGVLIVWSSVGFMELGILKKSPAVGVRMIYIYASLLVGGMLIALFAVEQLRNRPAEHKENKSLPQ